MEEGYEAVKIRNNVQEHTLTFCHLNGRDLCLNLTTRWKLHVLYRHDPHGKYNHNHKSVDWIPYLTWCHYHVGNAQTKSTYLCQKIPDGDGNREVYYSKHSGIQEGRCPMWIVDFYTGYFALVSCLDIDRDLWEYSCPERRGCSVCTR
jgi:hypothetical protein